MEMAASKSKGFTYSSPPCLAVEPKIRAESFLFGSESAFFFGLSFFPFRKSGQVFFLLSLGDGSREESESGSKRLDFLSLSSWQGCEPWCGFGCRFSWYAMERRLR